MRPTFYSILAVALLMFSVHSGLNAQPVTDAQGDVVIGGISPDPSAILDLKANDQGLLIPRLTSVERDGVANPAEGLMIYNTDLGTIQTWSDASGNWQWDAVVTTGTNFGWLTVGNDGLTDNVDNFLGTLDAVPVRMIVDDTERLILNTNGSIQRDIGGDPRGLNAVDLQVDRNISTQVASGDRSTIGGGESNMASGDRSTVAGGFGNQGIGYQSAVAGGQSNRAVGEGSFIGGGLENNNLALYSVIAGGKGGRIVGSSRNSMIGAGSEHQIGSNAPHSFIGAGINNEIETGSGRSAIVTGQNLTIRSSSPYSFIGAGQSNAIGVNSSTSVIVGGVSNSIGEQSPRSVIAGGQGNSIGERTATNTISGGIDNSIEIFAPYSVIGGGQENVIRNTGVGGVIAGGLRNEIDTQAIYSVISGGRENRVAEDYSSIAGGYTNTIDGQYSSILGGKYNTVTGNYSTIIGGNFLRLEGDKNFGFLGSDSPTRGMEVVEDEVAVFGNVDMWLASNDGNASQLRFYEAYGTAGVFPNGTHYTSFEAGAQTADINYILPASTTATTTIEDGILQLDEATGQLSWVDPTTLGVPAWALTGNAGTTPGTNYVGTSDSQALHLYVNGGTDNSLVLNTNGSIQHSVGGDARGTDAVDLQLSRIASSEVASGIWSTIGGGRRNQSSAEATTVAGGNNNEATAPYTSVGGGRSNTASLDDATISGGRSNEASGENSTVGGGYSNQATSTNTTVSGGRGNQATGSQATIAGGRDNRAGANVAVVSGGRNNEALGAGTAVGGGIQNVVEGDMSVIPGGRGLTLDPTASESFGFLGNTGGNDMSIAEANTATFGNVDLLLANNDSAASQLRFYEANSTTGAFPNGTNYTSFEAGAQIADINYILPITTTASTSVGDGLLQLDAATGQLSWADPTTLGVPAWALVGNAGTTPGTNYVGTSDAQALHIYVNGGTDIYSFNYQVIETD